jgi:predicted site-specific integrase-resolvase
MLITIEHAARELGVSQSTIRRWIKSGKLPASKPSNITYVFISGPSSTPEKKK